MSGSKGNYLPHFQKEMIPKKVNGNKLSMYSVALEGWRRGLKLKFFTEVHGGEYKILFSLSDENNKCIFQGSHGDKVQDRTVKTDCWDQTKTKEYLEKAGFLVPKGKKFELHSHDEEILSFVEEIDFPIAIKGDIGHLETVYDENELKNKLQKIKNSNLHDEIEIEQYIRGEHYKIYILDGKVISVIKIKPAHIVGDGKHSIEELIQLKNNERKNSPSLRTNLIEVNQDIINNLKKKNYSLQTILNLGKIIYLSSKCSLSNGGEPIVVTDQICEEIKEFAVKAIDTIPGLNHCELEMIVDNEDKYFITEINVQPDISPYIFPVEGEPNDIPKSIIDYYFPETINKERTSFYFNFDKIHNILRKGLMQEITISNSLKANNMIKKYYEAYGDVHSNRFHNWLLENTLKLNLNGFAKKLENGTKGILVYGDTENVNKFHKLLEKNVPLMNNVRYQNLLVDNPLNSGFEIID